MKIKIYIITYNNNKALNECLKSIYNSYYITNVKCEIYVINNNSNFSIDSKFKKVAVIHNSVRPDFSTGHLARDWNCGIINGFKDLNNPDCDILITCQNDTIFNEKWMEKLINYHAKYSFITMCPGDGFCSYTSDAIKNIGLWDERFNSISFQEADYFTRALIFNKDKSSINDFHHGRTLNTIVESDYDESFIYRKNTDHEIHDITRVNEGRNLKYFQSKYFKQPLEKWNTDFINHPPGLKEKLNLLYPYFEKNIFNLDQKYYLY